MRSTNAVALATMFFLNSVSGGLAREDCIKCTQNYAYICAQNHAECIAACGSIGATDKDACPRRCLARNSGCGEECLEMRDLHPREIRYSAASAYSVTGGHEHTRLRSP